MHNSIRIVALLIVLVLIAACGGGDATDTPTATATRETSPKTGGDPTATATPTETPIPTATPKATETLPPSSTPAVIDAPPVIDTPVPPDPVQPTVEPPPQPPPTLAPEATQPPRPTPGSVPTAVPPELAAYIQNVQSAYAGFPAAVHTLNGLLQNPSPGDGAWTGAMEGQISEFKNLYETIRDMNAPTGLEGTHSAIANALGTCNGVADVALQGLRNQAPGLLTESGNLARACADQLRQALGLLGEFGVQFEVPAIEVPQNP